MDLDSLERRFSERSPLDSAAASAAVALVLAPGEKGGFDLLLVERAVQEGDRWSGQIGLPGGRREPADADLLTTAVREAREETGLDLSRARLLGRLDDVEPRSRPTPPLAVRPFVFALAAKPELILSEELAGFLWFDASALKACAAAAPVVVGGASRQVEAFVCGRYVVWGLTHRILSQFLDILDAR